MRQTREPRRSGATPAVPWLCARGARIQLLRRRGHLQLFLRPVLGHGDGALAGRAQFHAGIHLARTGTNRVPIARPGWCSLRGPAFDEPGFLDHGEHQHPVWKRSEHHQFDQPIQSGSILAGNVAAVKWLHVAGYWLQVCELNTWEMGVY